MKHILTATLLLLALLLPATASAHDFEVNGIYYNINGNEATVTFKGQYFSYSNEYSGTVEIPETVTYNGTTYSVTTIGNEAFYRCRELTSVTIPNSVITIGYDAFYRCSGLTSVTIPNSVTSIGARAFYDCSGLTNVTTPNSVTSIGGGTFDGTAWYSNQPDGLVYAGLVAYKYKGTMPQGTHININNGTKGIADEAFFCCSDLTSVNIPNSVTSIGNGAFSGCSGLTSVNIPNSVTFIGSRAFESCIRLTNITVASDNLIYDSRNNCNGIIETSSNTLIFGCKNTVIPNSVTAIGDWAFSGCPELTSIEIPNSVTNVGISAFQGCTSLTSVSIPNSITSIGGSAFFGCSGLTSLTIGNSVIIIGSYAFYGCSGLTSLTLPNSVTTIGSFAFYRCSGLTSATLPNSVTTIGNYAFYGCSGLTNVSIPNSVTNIGDEAFYYCRGLTNVTCYAAIPPNISGNSFSTDTYSQATLIVPRGCQNAYQSANGWKNFSNIQELNYSFEVDGIYYGITSDNIVSVQSSGTGYYAGDVIIPATVKYNNTTYHVASIAESSFFGCSELKSITIPNTIIAIGNQAFMNAAAIESVTCKAETPPSWDGLDMFTTNVYNHTPLFVPIGCTRAYMSDQCWGQFVRIFSIGDMSMDGVLSISDVTTLINALLSGNNTSPAADVNGDGRVNISDVTMLINLLLSAEH